MIGMMIVTRSGKTSNSKRPTSNVEVREAANGRGHQLNGVNTVNTVNTVLARAARI
jgi:hypothetical protein